MRQKRFPAILIIAIGVLGLIAIREWMKGPQVRERTLDGMILVLDPPHGGVDPGTSRSFNGDVITENEYGYEIVQRIRRHAEMRGATIVQTLYMGGGIENSPITYIKDLKNERFVLDDSIATSDSSGLLKRVAIGKIVMNGKGKKFPVWLSIHIDNVSAEHQGIRVIYAPGSEKILGALDETFSKYDLLREDEPLVPNAMRELGIRDLRVLRVTNPIPDKVLIEVLNINNDEDWKGIRSPVYREEIALMIVEALETIMK